MGEQVTDALSMKYVSAAELDTRVTAQLAREADIAEIVLGYSIVLLALRLEAGQAYRLKFESPAGV